MKDPKFAHSSFSLFHFISFHSQPAGRGSTAMVVTRLEPSGLSHKVVPVPLKMTGSDSEETQRSDDSLGSSKFLNDKVEKNLIDHVGVLDNVVPGSPKLKGYGKAPMFVKSSIQLTMKIQGIPECLSKPMSCSQPSTTP